MMNLKRMAVMMMTVIMTASQSNISAFATANSDNNQSEIVDEYVDDSEVLEAASEYSNDVTVSDNSCINLKAEDGSVVIDEENFPDEVFRNYVSVNFDQDKNNVLSDAEITAAEYINLVDDDPDKPCCTVNGIEHFINLKTLWLAGDYLNLKEINLSNNIMLEDLNICSKKYFLIDISNNKALYRIELRGVANEEIDLTNNKELTEIYVFSKRLKNINFSENTKLESVRIDSPLEKLDLSDNLNMCNISCKSDAITEFELGDSDKYYDISLTGFANASDELWKNFDPSKYPGLEYLTVDNLKKDIFDLSNNTLIKELELKNSDIKKLDIAQNHLLKRINIKGSTLRELNLTGQNLKDLVFIKSNVKFKSIITNDQEDDWKNSQYFGEKDIYELVEDSYIEISEENFEDEIFRQYVSDKFDLNRDGKLSDAEILKVEKLIISDENIKSLKGIEQFILLDYLSLEGLTVLEEMDVSDNTNLDTIILKNVPIAILNLSKNLYLKTLKLYGSNITTLDLSKNLKFEELELYESNITILDLSKNNNLSSLRLYDNKELKNLTLPEHADNILLIACNNNDAIEAIDVSNMNNLRVLALSDNPMLKEVNLIGSDNPIFYGLRPSNYYYLDLENNNEKMALYISESQYNFIICKGFLDYFNNNNIELNIHTEHELNDESWHCDKKAHYQLCSRCSKIINSEAHNGQEIAAIPATCTAEGIPAYYKCKCGYYEDLECTKYIDDIESWKEKNIILVLPHNPRFIEAVSSNCMAQGVNAYYQCACGYYEDEACTKKIDDIEAWKNDPKNRPAPVEHKWDEGKITKSASFYEKGVKTYTCTVCNSIRTEDIARINVLEIPVKGKYDAKPVVQYLVSGNGVPAKCKYVVDNKKVAKVSKKGVITAKKSGTVKITVFEKGTDKEICSFDVTIRDTSVVKKQQLTALEQTIDLNKLITNMPQGYKAEFMLSKSNAKKALIDDKGILKPLKKGKVTVKCIISDGKNELKKSIKISVKISKTK